MVLKRTQSVDTSRARELRQLLRLALGHSLDEREVIQWGDLLARADRERLVALAWSRSGTIVRKLAPSEVSGAWRRRAAGVRLRSESQLSLLAEITRELRLRALCPIVLKGTPLAALLYGDPTVRSIGDIDLYVPPEERDAATATLVNLGWRSVSGEAPEEEMFERYCDGSIYSLELHSSAMDDPMLWHLRVPLSATWQHIAGVELPIFSGPYLPSYLAAHLAKHESPPFLWLVDFFTLWEKLSGAERRDAERAARECGLFRHLDWARDLAAKLDSATKGSDEAAEALTLFQLDVGDFNRVVRLVHLSGSASDAAKTIRGRLLPPGQKARWHKAPRALIRRAAGWAHTRWLSTTGSEHTAEVSQHSALQVDDEELATLLDESLGRGLAIWIRARGESMRPAVPSMAAVRILPLSGRTLRKGDVVLARLPHGQFVLHRIVRSADEFVHLKGDSLQRRDAVVPTRAIVGICDQVETEGRIWNIHDRPRDSVQLLTSALVSRTRAVLFQRAQ